MTKKMIIFLSAIFVCFSCENNQRAVAGQSTPGVSHKEKVGIYCWCFFNAPAKKEKANGVSIVEIEKSCTTPYSLRSSDLMQYKHLLLLVEKKTEIEKLRKLMFQGKPERMSNCDNEARFVLAFERDSISTDIFIYKSRNTFCYNGFSEFRFSFNVMDSIRHILDLENIDCPD